MHLACHLRGCHSLAACTFCRLRCRLDIGQGERLAFKVLIGDELGRRVASAKAQVIAQGNLLAIECVAQPGLDSLDDSLNAAGWAVDQVSFHCHGQPVDRRGCAGSLTTPPAVVWAPKVM
jgi:hypothetical protein